MDAYIKEINAQKNNPDTTFTGKEFFNIFSLNIIHWNVHL